MNPTQPDDVLLNKCAIIERCIKRMFEEYAACPRLDDYTHVDALTLNIQRACQAAIDMAMHIISSRHLGIPRSGSHAFSLLAENRIISKELTDSLRAMVGFRNIAVHSDQDIDQAIISIIVEKGFKDLADFCAQAGVKIHLEPFS